MRTSTLAAVPAALAFCALGLSAADVWNKDYKQWTDDDVQRVLTNSPWAKKATATLQSQGSGNGSQGSGGYPGGGGGRGGGMGGMGGMGGGFPGGGGMGGMGGGRRRGGQNPTAEKENVIVRWDSSMPVKEALLKQQYGSKLPDPTDPNYTLDKPGKDYVISVSGLRMSSRRDSSDDDSDDSRQGSTDKMRSTLLASTQLMPKGKSAIDPDDVKVTQQSDGSATAQFFFPRSPEIDLDDKEVTFLTQTGRMKIETKFKLKEMVADGKLALN
jgi:hypothetical protein